MELHYKQRYRYSTATQFCLEIRELVYVTSYQIYIQYNTFIRKYNTYENI
jgi:hypothetical protein